MDDTLKCVLATAVTAATEAFDAAQQGQRDQARELLTIVDEQLALCEGGNAAAAARRGKILRLQAKTQALLDAELVEAELVEAAPVEAAPVEPEPVQPGPLELPAEEAPVNLPLPALLPPVADAAPSPQLRRLGPSAGRADGAGRRSTEA